MRLESVKWAILCLVGFIVSTFGKVHRNSRSLLQLPLNKHAQKPHSWANPFGNAWPLSCNRMTLYCGDMVTMASTNRRMMPVILSLLSYKEQPECLLERLDLFDLSIQVSMHTLQAGKNRCHFARSRNGSVDRVANWQCFRGKNETRAGRARGHTREEPPVSAGGKIRVQYRVALCTAHGQPAVTAVAVGSIATGPGVADARQSTFLINVWT
jgi:hypothetical protein